MDEEGLDPEALDRACVLHGPRILFCSTNRQNPTTATMQSAYDAFPEYKAEKLWLAPFTRREHYENIDAVSMEWKPAWPEPQHTRKARLPDPGMNVTGLSKPYSTALSIDTIPNFLLAWLNKVNLYPSI